MMLSDLASGAALWRYDTGAPILASPSVAAGWLVVGTVDGQLFGFAAAPPKDGPQ